jgi:hypothetical protein
MAHTIAQAKRHLLFPTLFLRYGSQIAFTEVAGTSLPRGPAELETPVKPTRRGLVPLLVAGEAGAHPLHELDGSFRFCACQSLWLKAVEVRPNNGDPTGIRTPAPTVKGWCPNH